MAASIETLKLMDLSHLMAAVRTELDPLTSTPLELELLARLESITFTSNEQELQQLEDSLIGDASNSIAMLDVLTEYDISTPKALKAALETLSDFRTLADDAGDVFTRLSSLTTTVQE